MARALHGRSPSQYFMSTKNLNRRQSRSSEYLSRFQFHVVYRPGSLGGKPDSLTRRSQDLPKPGDPRLSHQSQVVLKSSNLPGFPAPPSASLNAQSPSSGQLNLSNSGSSTDPEPASEPASELASTPASEPAPDHVPASADDNHDLDTLISSAYSQDNEVQSVLACLRDGTRRHPSVSLSQCSERNGRLLFDHRLWIPADDSLRARLLHDHHDSPAAGHPGKAKTHELLSPLLLAAYGPRRRPLD